MLGFELPVGLVVKFGNLKARSTPADVSIKSASVRTES